MKKIKDTKNMEEYLEAHADELVDYNDENEEIIRHAVEDDKDRKARATALQRLRRDKLKLSQSELAKAVGANVRTLQSWEQGRQDYPKSVEILMTLMNKMPGVKKELVSPSVRNRKRVSSGMKPKVTSQIRVRRSSRKIASKSKK
jgi:DNA-binding transcriptional regulator YiaG